MLDQKYERRHQENFMVMAQCSSQDPAILEESVKVLKAMNVLGDNASVASMLEEFAFPPGCQVCAR